MKLAIVLLCDSCGEPVVDPLEEATLDQFNSLEDLAHEARKDGGHLAQKLRGLDPYQLCSNCRDADEAFYEEIQG